MDCVHEKDAKRISEENNKRLKGQIVTEKETGKELKIISVSYAEKKDKVSGKIKVMGYPVTVCMRADEKDTFVLLDKFEKNYSLK